MPLQGWEEPVELRGLAGTSQRQIQECAQALASTPILASLALPTGEILVHLATLGDPSEAVPPAVSMNTSFNEFPGLHILHGHRLLDVSAQEADFQDLNRPITCFEKRGSSKNEIC